jgi:hypothetical protein
MNLILIFNPVMTILCFTSAFVFFRKSDVSFVESFYPFITSLYSPMRMKEEIEPGGLYLIGFGYLSFIIWMFLS